MPFAAEVFVLLAVDRKGINDAKELVFLTIGENNWTNDGVTGRTVNEREYVVYHLIRKGDGARIALYDAIENVSIVRGSHGGLYLR